MTPFLSIRNHEARGYAHKFNHQGPSKRTFQLFKPNENLLPSQFTLSQLTSPFPAGFQAAPFLPILVKKFNPVSVKLSRIWTVLRFIFYQSGSLWLFKIHFSLLRPPHYHPQNKSSQTTTCERTLRKADCLASSWKEVERLKKVFERKWAQAEYVTSDTRVWNCFGRRESRTQTEAENPYARWIEGHQNPSLCFLTERQAKIWCGFHGYVANAWDFLGVSRQN
jgi:hypothetical protein